jgi:glycosyltransferase involved in cell wall biosynthesis
VKILFASFFDPVSQSIGATARSSAVVNALSSLGAECRMVALSDGLSGYSTLDNGIKVRRVPRCMTKRGLARAWKRSIRMWRRKCITGCEQIPAEFEEVFRNECEAFHPDIVVVDMLWVWPNVEKIIRDRPIIYLEHNIEYEVVRRFSAGDKNPLRKFLRWADAKAIEKLERHAWSRSAAIWTVSEREKLLHPPEMQPKTQVVVNSLPLDREPVEEKSGRWDLLFVGGLGYLPNSLGLHWFVHTVWPRLSIQGRRPLLAVLGGSGECPKDLKQTGIHWLGFVPDTRPVYADAKVAIAPIFTGGGTKLKVLEAFQLGMPLVASPQALEGLASGHAARMASTAIQWVETLQAILSEDTKTERQCNRLYYKENYDWRINISPILNTLRKFQPESDLMLLRSNETGLTR